MPLFVVKCNQIQLNLKLQFYFDHYKIVKACTQYVSIFYPHEGLQIEFHLRVVVLEKSSLKLYQHANCTNKNRKVREASKLVCLISQKTLVIFIGSYFSHFENL